MAKNVKEEKVSWRFMLPLVLGNMMNPLNSTMLATSLITICNSLKISPGEGAILITSLYITSTVAQPLMGRLADIYSAKKVNTLGFILVLIAALIGVIAPNLGWLVVSRIFLGLGTSAAYPSAMALINKKYASENRTVPGPVLGLVALAGQVSMVLGPTLGGILTQSFGWRGIFFINIPWVLVAMLLSRVIPDYPPAKSDPNISIFKKLDVPGILIFIAFLLSLLYVLISHNNLLLSIFCTVGFMALLVFWEWRHDKPFIDIKVLARSPALSLVYVRILATAYVLYLMLYAMPQWVESVKHVSPAKTGILLLPMSLAAVLIGFLISKSNKAVWQNMLGVLVLATACGGLFLLKGQSSMIFIIGFTLVMGTADGINLIANQALLNKESPLDQKGVSFGLSRTFSYIGAIVSSSQLKTLFHGGVTDQSFHHIAFYASVSCCVLIMLLVPLYLRRKKIEAN